MQVEAGENMPDIDRVGARVEGKGLKMAPFPWHLDSEREEASGTGSQWAFLASGLPVGEDEVVWEGWWHSGQCSTGKWSSSEVCGFLEEISTVKLKSWW